MDRETFLEILKKGKMMRASDIHLLAGEVPVFRINGKLIRIEEYNNCLLYTSPSPRDS